MTVSLPKVLAKKDMEIKVLRKILEHNIFVPENNKNIKGSKFHLLRLSMDVYSPRSRDIRQQLQGDNEASIVTRLRSGSRSTCRIVS